MVATVEPDSIVAGDTAEWTISLGDYAASGGWVLSYALVMAGRQIAITSSASGDDHAVSVTAATTATWIPGIYTWQSYVTKAGERHSILTGKLEVKPNFAVKTDGYDGRSHVQVVYEALKATLEKKATHDQLAYTIRGVSLSRMTPEQILRWYNQYKYEYEQEKVAENLEQGMNSGNKIKVRFT